MDDASQDAAAPAAVTDPKAEAAAAAKAAHQARHAALGTAHAAVIGTLGELGAQLTASLDKAAGDPGHADYTEAFLRDTRLKADEIVAWIKRHV